MAVPGVVTSILGWLRAGYPDGVPPKDYFPLLALLHRRLSPEEAYAVAAELVRTGHLDATNDEIGRLVSRITHEPPNEADVNRVRDQLVAGGGPTTDAKAPAEAPPAQAD